MKDVVEEGGGNGWTVTVLETVAPWGTNGACLALGWWKEWLKYCADE